MKKTIKKVWDLKKTAPSSEYWRYGTLNGYKITSISHRSHQGLWVNIGDEKWLVPYHDNQCAMKAGVYD